MNLNLKEKTSNISNTLMKDYWSLDMELGNFIHNIKKEVHGAIDFFFSLEKKMMREGLTIRYHRCWILDTNVYDQSLFSLIMTNVWPLLKNITRIPCVPMLLKSYCHLHLGIETSFGDKNEEDYILHIFEMVVIINIESQKTLWIENCYYSKDIKWTQRISNDLWSGGGSINPRSQLLGFSLEIF